MLGGYPLSRPNNLSVPGPAVGSWSMAAQVSTNGALIDDSGNGHHGWYGGVKKALLADTTYGDRGLSLHSIASNFATVPDGAANRPTGDLWMYADIRWVAYTSARALHGRWRNLGGGYCELLDVDATGKPALNWSTDGTTPLSALSTASLTTVVSAGARVQIYVTLDVDNGSGAYEVKFYWRVPGGTWAQLGNTVSPGGTTSVFAGTAQWETSYNNGTAASVANGVLYDARMGTGLVLDTGTTLSVDFTTQAQGTRSFVCSTGQTVTVNQAGTSTAEPTNLWYSGTVYGWAPGTAGNYFSVPDEAALRFTTEADFRADAQATDYSPSAAQSYFGRWTGTLDREYTLYNGTGGNLVFAGSSTGAAGGQFTATATVVTPVSDGTRAQFRATFIGNNGSAVWEVRFYYRTDGDIESNTGWTQIGNAVNGVSTTALFAGTSDLAIGALSGGTSQLFGGSVYRVLFKSSIGGTTVFDTDFTALASYNATYTTLTAVTGQTVTINRSATGLKTAIVTENVALFDGVDDYISIDDHDRLDFAAGESLTAVAVIRHFTPTTAAASAVLVKRNDISGGAASAAGWALFKSVEGYVRFRLDDASNICASDSAVMTAGERTVLSGVRAVSADTIVAYRSGVAGTAANDNTTGTLANALALYIGRAPSGGSPSYSLMEFVGAGLYRRALSPAQILRLNTEL